MARAHVQNYERKFIAEAKQILLDKERNRLVNLSHQIVANGITMRLEMDKFFFKFSSNSYDDPKIVTKVYIDRAFDS